MISILTSCALFVTMASARIINYDDLSYEELKDMTVFQRIKAHDWKLEYMTIGFTLAFVVLFKIGDYLNERKVTTFLNSQKELFLKNFAQFGVSPDATYIKDLSEAYSSYASGRENIAKVDITFKLKPRHNTFVWLLESLLSFFTESVSSPQDRVDIVITPSIAYDNFITAIVSKIGMNDYRKFNYYLSLTKTSDSDKLPESFVFMSEASEFQEKTLTEPLREALKLETGSFLRYIAFTDQAVEKPATLVGFQPQRRIILSTHLVSGKQQLQQITDILGALFALVDDLASKKIEFKVEALRKIVKTRENEIAKFRKVEEEVKAEIKAEEDAKLKKEERDRVRKLSPAEQEKIEKKALEKQKKKAMKKQKVRM